MNESTKAIVDKADRKLIQLEQHIHNLDNQLVDEAAKDELNQMKQLSTQLHAILKFYKK